MKNICKSIQPIHSTENLRAEQISELEETNTILPILNILGGRRDNNLVNIIKHNNASCLSFNV